MKLSIKYFGEIAERSGSHQEELQIEDNISVEKLKAFIEKKHTFEDLHYTIAINQKLVNDNRTIHNNDEVAFLPPFAGG